MVIPNIVCTFATDKQLNNIIIMEQNNRITLEKRVLAIADSGKAKGMPNKFNLPQNKENREKHIGICKKLAEISKAHNNFPITYLVYFAIGKNAHRISVFLDGYKKIDEKKAETILSWMDLFAKHHKNPKMAKNANIAHALCKFYDKCDKTTKAFKAALNGAEADPTIKDFKGAIKALGIEKKVETEEMAMAMAEV